MKNMMKVLIVEDDEALAGLIKEMIEKMGTYRVKTAVNGEEGYEIFLHFKPDIILRDMRNHDPGIKTIYMSGNLRRFRTRLEEEKTKYKASLLDKPFSFSKLTGLFHEYQKEGGDKR